MYLTKNTINMAYSHYLKSIILLCILCLLPNTIRAAQQPTLSSLVQQNVSQHDKKYLVACYVCDRLFDTIKGCSIHFARAHKENPKFDLSRVRRTSSSILVKSNPSLSKKTEFFLLKCKECNTCFRQQRWLTIHMQNHHPNIMEKKPVSLLDRITDSQENLSLYARSLMPSLATSFEIKEEENFPHHNLSDNLLIEWLNTL